MVNENALKKITWWRWLIAASSLLIVVVVILAVLEKTHVIDLYSKPTNSSDQPKATNTIDYSPPTSADSDISNQVKDNSTTPTPQDFQVTLTQVTQDPSTHNLMVRGLIQGVSTGTCTLDLTKNDSILLTKQADVTLINNYAICSGFDILATELPIVGEVTVKLSVTSDGVTKSESQNILLEK
jgi:hypothetical protein